MSTAAQITTIATYKMALLNNPPLGAAAGRRPANSTRTALTVGTLLPSERAYVTQRNSCPGL
jgi:hypothetical protein